MKSLHVRLPEDLHRKLKAIASYKEQSVQEYVEALMLDHLSGLPDPPEGWQ